MSLALLLACAPAPLTVDARVVDGGIEVRGSRALDHVVLTDDAGTIRGSARSSTPGPTATVLLPIVPGERYRVEATAPDGTPATTRVEVPVGCFRAEIEIPAGQARWPVTAGDWAVPSGQLETPVALRLTALEPCSPTVRIGPETTTIALPTAGAREVLTTRVGAEPVSVAIDALRFRLVPEPPSLPTLRVVDWRFPADARGDADDTRAADRIDLPPEWWSLTLGQLGLGTRARADQMPWAWQSLTLANDGTQPVNLLIQASIERDGRPAPAFDTRIRERSVAEARALLAVPAGGQAQAILPVFVDPKAIHGRQQVTRRIRLTPLGADTPSHDLEAPLGVARGSSWATAGLVGALTVSMLGWLGVVSGLRRLGRERTSDLVTVALFASATWVIGAAFQVVGTTVGWLLGPFTPLVMGLPDQAFRACLLATLLTILPRPGVLALSTGVGFLLRGLTFGALHPTDLLYLGSAIAFLEAGAWLSGLTRDGAWRDAPPLTRWLRLTLGLGCANIGATAAGLVVTATLYRLYLADWYVVSLLALPGFAWVAVGCALAVPFASSLRDVRR